MAVHHDSKHNRTWTRDGFLISTDPTLLSIPALNEAFASPSLYWAKALPEEAMRAMIANSLCFGLYTPTPVPHDPDADSAGSHVLKPTRTSPPPPTPANPPSAPASIATPIPSTSTSNNTNQDPDSPTQIGFARCITDHTTFLYLTDVYVLSEWRHQGLGSWLLRCVQEVVDSMPHLRRSMCITSNDEGVGMYERRMRMVRIGQGTRRRLSVAERLGFGSPEREGATSAAGHHGGEPGKPKELVVLSARGPGAMV